MRDRSSNRSIAQFAHKLGEILEDCSWLCATIPAGQECIEHKTSFLRFSDLGRMVPDIVIDALDILKDLHAATDEQLHAALEPVRSMFGQRFACIEMLTSIRNPIGKSFARLASSILPVLLRYSSLLHSRLRQVVPFSQRIDSDILAKVSDLKPCAYRIRPAYRSRVARASKSKDQATDGICRASAVIEQLAVILVGIDRLVLDECREEILEGLDL